ncbi:MAG: hypothetical protein IT532_06015 [Burkholderiales bacterium]|nr:hypothetical protein [Burkholderiales bacterium]
MSSFRIFALGLIGLLALSVSGAHAAGTGGMYSAYQGEDTFAFNRAFDISEAASLDEVVKTLSRAIRQLSRYRVPKEAPRIYRVPKAELENYVCGTHCAIQAWYRPGDGIFLDDTLRPESNLFHRSILLHELVHYFQDQGGEYADMAPCDRWFHRELDAYNVQNRYLGVIGHPSRVAYAGDNCVNMEAKARANGEDEPAQAYDGIRGRVKPDMH